MNENLDKKIQRCLNPDCNTVLFISRAMAPGEEVCGSDRDLEIQRDDYGPYIECPHCYAKHELCLIRNHEGGGMTYKISRLRKI